MEKNNSMNNTIIFLSLLVIFLSIVLEINICFCVDMLSNKIVLIINIYGIRVFQINFDIIGLFYEVNNSRKFKKISDIFSKENNYFFQQIKKSVLDKLYYGRITLNTACGVCSAKESAEVVSFLNILCFVLQDKMRGNDIEFVYSNYPIYTKTNIKIDITIKVFFTIFDMVFAIIISLYKRGRYVRKIKKQRV